MAPHFDEAELLAALRLANGRDDALLDLIVEIYLREHGDDHEAKIAAIQRLRRALMQQEEVVVEEQAAQAARPEGGSARR